MNPVGDLGVKALATNLKYIPKLIGLCLSNNLIIYLTISLL